MAYLYTRYLKRKEGICTNCKVRMEERKETEGKTETLPQNREYFLMRDQEYFRNLYPLRIRRMKDYVREELELLGTQSFWRDEYPDRVRLDQVRDRVFRKMQQDSVEETRIHEAFSRDVVETLLYQEILEQRSLHY